MKAAVYPSGTRRLSPCPSAQQPSFFTGRSGIKNTAGGLLRLRRVASATSSELNNIHWEALSKAEGNGLAGINAILPQILPFLIYVGALIALSLAGLVLFCIQVHHISFQPSPLELPGGTKLKTVCLNPGMMLFIASSLALILSAFIV